MGATIDRGKTDLVDFCSEFAGGRPSMSSSWHEMLCADAVTTRCSFRRVPSACQRILGGLPRFRLHPSALHPLFRRDRLRPTFGRARCFVVARFFVPERRCGTDNRCLNCVIIIIIIIIVFLLTQTKKYFPLFNTSGLRCIVLDSVARAGACVVSVA